MTLSMMRLLFMVLALALHESTASEAGTPWDEYDDRKLNEILVSAEKNDAKGKTSLTNETVGPISVRDVKCLLSDGKYHCSERMGIIKGILLKMVENDCRKCTTEEKRAAGIMLLSLLVHDRAALRMFLIKHNGIKKLQVLGS